MKVALGIRTLRPVGGAEKIVRRLVHQLMSDGHDVTACAYDMTFPGVAWQKVARPRVPRFMRDWAMGRGIARAVSGVGADVLFGEQKTWNVNVLRPGGGVEKVYWQKHMRYRYPGCPECSQHLFLKRAFDVAAERAGYFSPHLRRVVANSHMIKQELLTHYPHLEGKISVIYNGCDSIPEVDVDVGALRDRVVREAHLDPEQCVVLFAGHDFRRKGLRYALEAVAVAKANGSPVQLLVAGRDKRAPFARLAERLGIRDAVSFVGRVADMADLYRVCDGLVLPTFYDPFANVTIEAMGAGLPVITTKQNGGSELITPESGWVLASPERVDDMASAYHALSDASRRRTMSQAARDAASAHRAEDKMKELQEVLMEVAEEIRRGPTVPTERTGRLGDGTLKEAP